MTTTNPVSFAGWMRRFCLWTMVGLTWSAGAVETVAAEGDAGASPPSPWQWSKLASIPDGEGFAGVFAGVSGGSLIVAGGANFPDGPPWEGGQKRFHDRVFALSDGGGSWREVGMLPRPLAYGVSLSTNDGIACLGGTDGERHYDDCFVLQYDGRRVVFRPLPPLPRRCANAAGVVSGRTIFVAAGTTDPNAQSAERHLWALELDRVNDGWQSLDPIPGRGRILPTMGELAGDVFLFGGAALEAQPSGPPTRIWLRDAYRFTHDVGWKQIAAVPRAVVAAPTPAAALGREFLVLLGGDDGLQAAAAPETHRGFSRDVLAYHATTDTWQSLGTLPFALVTTPAVAWNKRIVVPGGEQRPGIRSTDVWAAEFESRKAEFGWVNYTALITYLGAMVGIGWVCRARNKNTEDYFKAGGRIPWWAAGISIYATTLSSITFMSIPAKAYATDWTFVWTNLPILILVPFIIRYYLPFFRQVKAASAYEYLERRFNLAVRWYASAAFILFQIGRQAIVLLLPAMALAAVSDMEISTCVVLMGLLCVTYTVLGGMEAVVWTDVAQTVVLLGAAVLSLAYVVVHTEGGLGAFWSIAEANDKLRLFNWTWDPSVAANAFWVILVGNLFISLVSYTSDQAVVQRYMTTADMSTAARAIWTNGLLAIPTSILFFAIGTALFVYYSQHPQALEPGQPTDAIFAVFIVKQLPVGLAGLVVAGVFAAAQSTVSGSLNSVATALTTDFVGRLRRDVRDDQMLRLARRLTALVGVFATSVALLLAKLNLASLWDAYFNLVGLAASGLAGLFALGIFTRRATGAGALIGAAFSAATLYYVQRYTQLHFFLYSFIGFWTCVASGWLASRLLPSRIDSLAGLTIFTQDATPAERQAPKATTASQVVS